MVLRSLQQVTDEIHRLRQQRGTGAHLPEQLREAAAHLAASHGIRSVSRDLDVCRNSLRLWMKRYPKPSRKKSKVARSLPAATPTPVAFFEIKADAPVPIGPASADATQTVELRRPDGWTLRVSGDLAKELAPVMLQKFSTLQGAAT